MKPPANVLKFVTGVVSYAPEDNRFSFFVGEDYLRSFLECGHGSNPSHPINFDQTTLLAARVKLEG